ncbi:hypothetical protein [Chitiniphilus shinanonensis]|uniref:hypothetical protein n=1 Tax=Chitiniphilus shinanonensis TaxID=553088 RepID=UPI0012F9F9B7|nr:hypothetical protein [Chitiniphilus shinanonensis]
MQASFPNHPAGEAVASDAADREHRVRPRRVDHVDSESLEPVQGLFTTAFGAVPVRGKAQDARRYEYRERRATQPCAGNAPNPKGRAGKRPSTALYSLVITRYCLRHTPCA